jgi:hypothetical protein
MNKPLKDWTVRELIEHCINHRCENCDFGSTGEADASKCIFKHRPPCSWHDPRKPKFTGQEREDAAVLARAFSDNWIIKRYNVDETLFLFNGNGFLMSPVEKQMFPSIKRDESYTLAEIAGCEE